MKERRIQSYRALSQFLGEPLNRIWLHIQLLDLPEPVKAFLREHRGPKYLRYFTERRLRGSVDQASADRPFDRRPALGRCDDPFDGGLNFGGKIESQPCLALLVIGDRFQELRARLGMNRNRHAPKRFRI